MRTTVFNGREMAVGAYDTYERVVLVSVPTLSAYAIEHADFNPPIGVTRALVC